MIRWSFIFKESYIFIEEEEKPSGKVIIVEEELDGVDIDGSGSLVDLPRLTFINKEYGNLKVVVDGRELTINIDRKKESDVLQACRCPTWDEFYTRDWGKYDFSYVFISFVSRY